VTPLVVLATQATLKITDWLIDWLIYDWGYSKTAKSAQTATDFRLTDWLVIGHTRESLLNSRIDQDTTWHKPISHCIRRSSAFSVINVLLYLISIPVFYHIQRRMQTSSKEFESYSSKPLVCFIYHCYAIRCSTFGRVVHYLNIQAKTAHKTYTGIQKTYTYLPTFRSSSVLWDNW